MQAPPAASSCGATFFGARIKTPRRTIIVAPRKRHRIPVVSIDTTVPGGLPLRRFSSIGS